MRTADLLSNIPPFTIGLAITAYIGPTIKRVIETHLTLLAELSSEQSNTPLKIIA